MPAKISAVAALAHSENMSGSTVEAALQALREGKPVCILDARFVAGATHTRAPLPAAFCRHPAEPPLCRNREGETDIYFSGLATHAPQLRMLRTAAGGELYIAVGHEVCVCVCMCPWMCADSGTQTTRSAAACRPPSLRQHVLASLPWQVSEAFGLPYAGTAMKEAAAKWPVVAGMGKCDGEMCQVRRGMLWHALLATTPAVNCRTCLSIVTA